MGSHTLKCAIAVSISTNLRGIEYRPYPTEEQVKDALATFKASMYKPRQVYENDTCAICLEGGPNAILCTCGHQCAHLGCLGQLCTCPFCRSSIMTVLHAAVAKLDHPHPFDLCFSTIQNFSI